MATPDYLKNAVLAFDTETAVLGDHVCEIGFSLFKDGACIKEWGTFVKPIVQIDPEAQKVHNITAMDLQDSPTFKDIAWWVYNTLAMGTIHIAYNYDYDRSVLGKEFARVGMKFPVRPMIDPLIYFKKWNT